MLLNLRIFEELLTYVFKNFMSKCFQCILYAMLKHLTKFTLIVASLTKYSVFLEYHNFYDIIYSFLVSFLLVLVFNFTVCKFNICFNANVYVLLFILFRGCILQIRRRHLRQFKSSVSKC